MPKLRWDDYYNPLVRFFCHLHEFVILFCSHSQLLLNYHIIFSLYNTSSPSPHARFPLAHLFDILSYLFIACEVHNNIRGTSCDRAEWHSSQKQTRPDFTGKRSDASSLWRHHRFFNSPVYIKTLKGTNRSSMKANSSSSCRHLAFWPCVQRKVNTTSVFVDCLIAHLGDVKQGRSYHGRELQCNLRAFKPDI